MAAEGLHQPIAVRGPLEDGTFQICWGHRRFLAAQLLNWRTLTTRILPPSFDPALAAVTENLQRTDLTPIEEARAAHRFLIDGHPVAAIARLFRRSQAWVTQRLHLLELPQDLQDRVHQGRLSMAVALPLADVDHHGYRADLIAEAERTGASASTAELWRAHYLSDRDRLIRNQETIEQFRERREAWKIYVGCEGCGAEVDYSTTRSWRFCARCSHEIQAALAPETPSETPTKG